MPPERALTFPAYSDLPDPAAAFRLSLLRPPFLHSFLGKLGILAFVIMTCKTTSEKEDFPSGRDAYMRFQSGQERH